MQRTMYDRYHERLESRRHPSGSVWGDYDRPRRDADEDLASRPCTDAEAEAFRRRLAEADARTEALHAAEVSCPAPREVEGVGWVSFTVSRPSRYAVWVGAGEAPELAGYTDQPTSDEAVQAVYDRFCEECE